MALCHQVPSHKHTHRKTGKLKHCRFKAKSWGFFINDSVFAFRLFSDYMYFNYPDVDHSLVDFHNKSEKILSIFRHCMRQGRARECASKVESMHVSWHDDNIKWKHFPRYWPFVRGIHRSPVYSPHKGMWHGTLMFVFICAWINRWVNNREAGDFRRYRVHYDVIVLNFQSHPQHQLWISTWRIFHEFHKNNARLKLSWKIGEPKSNPCWLFMLTNSSGTN